MLTASFDYVPIYNETPIHFEREVRNT